MTGHLYMVPQGGFGNVLFVYMCGYSLAKKYSKTLFFVTNYNDWRKKMHQYTTFKSCNYIELSPEIVKKCTVFVEPEFKSFNYRLIELQPAVDYMIKGFFQSFRYAQEFLSEIKKRLFSEHPRREYVQGMYQELADGHATVMVHVRRTDYLKLGHVYTLLDDQYYQEAIAVMVSKIGACRLLLFSDDPDFLRTWPLVRGCDHQIVNLTDPEETFLAMTMCDHFIAANSSFSVLAWLFRDNPDAHLCLPKRWFASGPPDSRIGELVPITERVHVL